ncbi:hypothetical protein [Haloferax sp. DFSO60]|uniref:hypothetical protein n=1 Tax=Haloferax sp. DFSO60 TaxID=3388652 RepID=UPI00397C7B24
MRLRNFVALTAVAHVVLAALVKRDADKRGASACPWVGATLLTGVVGAVGYVLRGR